MLTVDVIPSFECAGVTVKYTDETSTPTIQFREAGGVWHRAHTLYNYALIKEFRGSIFWLKENTDYEVEVGGVTKTFKTRNSHPPMAELKIITSGTTITESGTPEGYIYYTCLENNIGSVVVRASYIVLVGLLVKDTPDTGILVSGENIEGQVHDVILDGCQLANNGPTAVDSPSISSIRIDYAASRVTVQNCDIYVTNPNALGDRNGIYHWRAGEQLVFRHNKIHGEPWDGIGGGPEGSTATLNDCDVYENEITEAWDDGIQIEGGCINTRAWGNKIKSSMLGITVAPVLEGPAYILFNQVCADKTKRIVGVNGLLGSGKGAGRVYCYNNSFWGMAGSIGFSAKNYGVYNHICQNNIIYTDRYAIEWGHEPDGTDCVMTSNILSHRDTGYKLIKWGAAATNYVLGSNLEDVDPLFVDVTIGDFNLSPGSPAIGAGVVLPNINDDTAPVKYRGNNIGAVQSTEEEPIVGEMKTFSGGVSDQVAAAEVITVAITTPLGSTDVITGATLEDKSYSVTYEATQPGTYLVVATIGNDGVYSSAISPEKTFSVLIPRTITLEIS